MYIYAYVRAACIHIKYICPHTQNTHTHTHTHTHTDESHQDEAKGDSRGKAIEAAYHRETSPQYAEYIGVPDPRFDRLTATVRVSSVGKLLVVDSSSCGVHLVYALLDIPRAGSDMLHLEVPHSLSYPRTHSLSYPRTHTLSYPHTYGYDCTCH